MLRISTVDNLTGSRALSN